MSMLDDYNKHDNFDIIFYLTVIVTGIIVILTLII